MQLAEKASQKRPLSFSDDAYEWDSIRDDVPADIKWNSMKSVLCEDSERPIPRNDFSIAWVPNGYEFSSGRPAKRRKMMAPRPPVVKPKSTFTCEFLDEGDKELASSIIQNVSSAPGTFVFESAEKEAFTRLIPIPAGMSTDKATQGNWHMEGNDCNLETLLTSVAPKTCRISFPAWGTPQRKDRKYETLHVDRNIKMEDIQAGDGPRSWSILEALVKRQFVEMPSDSRYAAAKSIVQVLNALPKQ
ncbi:unnamed protein product [Cylicocyclus nassatus]|uniref:Uncharacterized protein n=1 Tax=Cylicocyclus nassatus TaxID=53992 RepID=A0AA36H149_CYLNA|nr:unnamed protein product [Cylicocyclus nassatus]